MSGKGVSFVMTICDGEYFGAHKKIRGLEKEHNRHLKQVGNDPYTQTRDQMSIRNGKKMMQFKSMGVKVVIQQKEIGQMSLSP